MAESQFYLGKMGFLPISKFVQSSIILAFCLFFLFSAPLFFQEAENMLPDILMKQSSGRPYRAFKLLKEAANLDVQNAEIFLHLAIVSANSGNPGSSEAALKRALTIDPKLQESAEVKQLRSDLNRIQSHE
jgi:hypothetical protein